jgi:hypothetical protein
MTIAAHAPTSSAVDPRTRLGLGSLIAGSVLLAIGRLMSTQGGSPADRLQQMSGHDGQVTASSLLAFLGFCALIPGFLAVAALVRNGFATAGAGLVVIGSVGFAVLAAVDISTLAATHVDSTDAMKTYLHQLDVAPGILAITPLAIAGYFVGPFLVTFGMQRAGLVPRWLPWGILASLILQPIGLGIGGPALAQIVDGICQLALVAMVAILARSILHRPLGG